MLGCVHWECSSTSLSRHSSPSHPSEASLRTHFKTSFSFSRGNDVSLLYTPWSFQAPELRLFSASTTVANVPSPSLSRMRTPLPFGRIACSPQSSGVCAFEIVVKSAKLRLRFIVATLRLGSCAAAFPCRATSRWPRLWLRSIFLFNMLFMGGVAACDRASSESPSSKALAHSFTLFAASPAPSAPCPSVSTAAPTFNVFATSDVESFGAGESASVTLWFKDPM
mmetsp:Transcript_66727/g.139072  ORF Transcript_66727/g.139072 Transcript_66727/m.139072 type:complete len:224 (+) Transcript_66727:185-856(+)